MHRTVVRNETRDTTLACAEWRGTILGRARGLLGRSSLREGDGIVISPCNSVHMMFMRFPIDVVYVDRDGRVVKTVACLRPFRFSVGGRGAHIAVELPAGSLEASGTNPGDQLVFES